MMDDYYLLLGIPRNSGMTEIKRAYRRLSLRFHPDVAGDDALDGFLRVREAYDTLAHTANRVEYNRRLAQAEHLRRADRPEPLFGHALDLLNGFATVHPGVDELMAHMLTNFTGGAAKSNPTHELNVEVVLTHAQAARGGAVPMVVPVARVCTVCGGTGRAGFFACEACDAHGTVWQRASVDVPVPRGAGNGAVIETSLRHLGIRNMWLKTHVRVADMHA